MTPEGKGELQNASLEEYKTLREELLLHIKVINQIIVSSGALYFVALTFLSKIDVNYDLSGILLLSLLIPLFFKYRYEVFTIAKIASYIEKCIETKIDGLNWTGLHMQSLSKHRSSFTLLTFLGGVWRNAEVFYFLILLTLTWLLPLYLKKAFYSVGATVIMLILTAVYIYNFVVLRKYAEYRSDWDRTWDDAVRKQGK
jgi:hypothetical protein